MVLVEHDPVHAHLLGVHVLLQPLVVEPAALVGVEVFVGEQQGADASCIAGLLLGVGRHGLLGKVHQVHGFLLSYTLAICLISLFHLPWIIAH